MADFTEAFVDMITGTVAEKEEWANNNVSLNSAAIGEPNNLAIVPIDIGAGGAVKYFLMVAEDDNASGGVGEERPYYRSWVVSGAPDFTGASYSGAYFGVSKNFVEVTIQSQWAL